MLKISKLTDYATLIMAEIAQAPDKRQSAKTLSTQLKLPISTTSKLLKDLTRNKLLKSHRGKDGGYQLAKPAEEITLADVVSHIDGTIAITECSDPSGDCPHKNSCHVKQVWQQLNQVILQHLQKIPLTQVAK